MGYLSNRIGCLSVRGQYRPNRTPGTKRGVGAQVRPSRQSRDCLRGRPFRAPPLFAAVRPARPLAAPSGFASLRQPDRFATGASRGRYCPPLHGRVGGTSSYPRSARAVSFGVSLCIHPHLCGLLFRVEYHPSPYPRTSAASAQSRLAQRLRPHG